MAIRSAKTKAITPPKEIPPDHRAAASGTLPMEQTQLITAISGPTRAFSMLVQIPWPWRKRVLQTSMGTTTASTPATTYPMTSSLRSMVTSATA